MVWLWLYPPNPKPHSSNNSWMTTPGQAHTLPLSISRSTLARDRPRFSIPRVQRIPAPLTLDHAQRPQCVGLRFLQRRCLCNSSWYVLGFHLFISRSYLIIIAPFALGQPTLTMRTMISFANNGLITLSTIHAQDFQDEVCDKLIRRRTIPNPFRASIHSSRSRPYNQHRHHHYQQSLPHPQVLRVVPKPPRRCSRYVKPCRSASPPCAYVSGRSLREITITA